MKRPELTVRASYNKRAENELWPNTKAVDTWITENTDGEIIKLYNEWHQLIPLVSRLEATHKSNTPANADCIHYEAPGNLSVFIIHYYTDRCVIFTKANEMLYEIGIAPYDDPQSFSIIARCINTVLMSCQIYSLIFLLKQKLPPPESIKTITAKHHDALIECLQKMDLAFNDFASILQQLVNCK